MAKRKRGTDTAARIEELERIVREQKQLIEHLDKVNQMHIQAEELSRQERMSADRVLHAQEQLQELAARERMEADRVIRAQAELHAFTEKERRDADRVINAQKELHSLTEKERLEAAELNRALLEVQELSERERKETEGLMEVHRRVEEMSLEEIRQRDSILESILDISKQINKLLPEDELFFIILESAMGRLEADAGAVIMHDQGGSTVRVMRGLPEDLTEAALLARARDCQIARQGGPGVARETDRRRIASILSRESRPIGLIYLEQTRKDGRFRGIDQEFLDLFASHASMACNNAFLFNKVQKQNRELKRVLMVRNNFIDHLSGDLRRPLIRLGELVEQLPGGHNRDEAVDIASWVIRALDKVLSAAALNQESEEMFSHQVSIEELVQEIIAALEPEIRRLDIEVRIETEGDIPRLEGNRDIFITILDEIICNAVVYNKPGGSVTIRISTVDQRAFISVTDTGIGIKKGDIRRVFNRFFRAESSYNYYKKGAGLGLFIVRSFVENYGGNISLTSNEGEGTRIIIELPV